MLTALVEMRSDFLNVAPPHMEDVSKEQLARRSTPVREIGWIYFRAEVEKKASLNSVPPSFLGGFAFAAPWAAKLLMSD